MKFPKDLHIRALALALLLMISSAMPAHQLLPADLTNPKLRYSETNPPQGSVRPVAEFEPSSHVLIRYPLGIPVALVAQLSNTAAVICLVSSASQQNSASSAFSSAGVNMARVSFVIQATDSYWTRDYGPWFIVDGNDQFAVVDFVYNRPRPSDNAVAQAFAQQQNFPYYGMNLQQTGGNYMTDGIGIAAQTTLVYTENSSLGQTGVQNKMQQYMGADTFYGIADPNNTYIDHIDCWSKFLAPDKVLVRSVPTTHPQYNAIEQAANYFASRNCSWGYPWKVYRVNTPQNQPYTNSLILNKKVFVPTMNSSYDAAALQAYRNALPGYEVIGVPQAGSTPWESTDALHCRTHEIPDRGALYISHNPVWGMQQGDAAINIDAYIKAYNGGALYSDSLKVVYKVNQSPWQSELLQDLGAGNFRAMLSGFAPGDTIRYFIHAADVSGRSTDHPFTGGWDTHLFYMAPDQIPPSITHTVPIDVITQNPVLFQANVTDNVGVGQVMFRYRIDSQAELSVPMDDMGEGIYSFTYYPDFTAADQFLYYLILASDTSNPPNQAVYPSEGTWQAIPLKVSSTGNEVIPAAGLAIRTLYPNPFRAGAEKLRIDYQSSSKDHLYWTVFNIRGQLVTRGVSSPKAGEENFIQWDGRDLKNNVLPSGIYMIKINQSGIVQMRKLVLTN